MIRVPEITVGEVSVAIGDGRRTLVELAEEAVGGIRDVGGVVAATFSNPERFPALSVRVASMLGLPSLSPAFDIQMACSAYPYAVYLAGRMAKDIGKRVLVVDGDVQSALVDRSDHATGAIFSDAVTASVVGVSESGESTFDFMSRSDDALICPSAGPIKMDGFKVFTFVATEVVGFLRAFGDDFDLFIPHQANPYMIRQLSKSLGLETKLRTIAESALNPGSCSIPMAIAGCEAGGRALIAGFGAGYSASAGIVRIVR